MRKAYFVPVFLAMWAILILWYQTPHFMSEMGNKGRKMHALPTFARKSATKATKMGSGERKQHVLPKFAMESATKATKMGSGERKQRVLPKSAMESVAKATKMGSGEWKNAVVPILLKRCHNRRSEWRLVWFTNWIFCGILVGNARMDINECLCIGDA